MKTPPKLEAMARWHRVSRKELDADTVEWLVGVARGMLEAGEEKDANRRRALALQAAGLVGRASVQQHALAAIAGLDGQTRTMAAGIITGHFPGSRSEISPEALRKRLSRARKTRP